MEEGGERERGRGGTKELTRACIRVYEVVHERVHHLHIVAPLSANDSKHGGDGGGVCVPFTPGGRVIHSVCACACFSDLRVGIWSWKVFESFFF